MISNIYQKICVSVNIKNSQQARQFLEIYDFLEFRLDVIDATPDEMQLIFNNQKRTIATFRGNHFSIDSKSLYYNALIHTHVDYIDIDITEFEYFKNIFSEDYISKHLILSWHSDDNALNYNKVRAIYEKIRKYRPRFIKIVYTPFNIIDLEIMRKIYQETQSSNLICFGMGDVGKLSRVECLLIGSPYTYACDDVNNRTAPGQISYSDIINAINILC